MAQICKTYTTSTNNVQTRIVHVFCNALKQDKAPMSSVYGAITGLAELGSEVVKVFVIPRIKDIGARLQVSMEGPGHTQAEKASGQRIENLLCVRNYKILFLRLKL